MTERLAWLIPCLNEARTIETVVRQIREHSPQSSIYVYDNGSTDGTAEAALAAGATVRREVSKGKGFVVRRMFDELDADICILVDGDATYCIADWRKLVEPIESGRADIVVAERLTRAEPGAFRHFHLVGNQVITRLVNVLFGARLSDVLSGYRALSRSAYKLIPLHAKGFEVETELTIQALGHRFRIEEVSAPYAARPSGSQSKLRTWSDGLLVQFTLLKLVKDHKPLTSFGTLALGLGALAVAALETDGRLAALVLLMGALTAMCTGFVLNSHVQTQREWVQLLRRTYAKSGSPPVA